MEMSSDRIPNIYKPSGLRLLAQNLLPRVEGVVLDTPNPITVAYKFSVGDL
jgi:hypothetical protein